MKRSDLFQAEDIGRNTKMALSSEVEKVHVGTLCNRNYIYLGRMKLQTRLCS